MQDIEPTVARMEAACAETRPGPIGMVVFGASGDLAHRKLLPSLFGLFRAGLLSEHFYLVGAGRKKISDEDFRSDAGDAIAGSGDGADRRQIEAFTEKLYFATGDYYDTAFYSQLKTRLSQLDARHGVAGEYVFYLAVPPMLYADIAERLCSAGLSGRGRDQPDRKPRLVVEKPFGRDLASAAELNRKIASCFDESQIYRIDHYLGKETVQNILVLRFANTIFEPIWNRNYVDSVQITIAETLGIEHRASYYDKAGALRDIFQNHMLQMLALVAMEPPTSFEADRVRDEKVKLLRSVRAFDIDNVEKFIVRGQYGPGTIDGREVVGYRDEPGVVPDSRTETFVAAKVFIDNWRWKDVPFYLRTGKRLTAKDTEVCINFRAVPHSMFEVAGVPLTMPNVLVLQIQPDEGISLSFQAKRPGSKVCVDTLRMSFLYKDIFGVRMPQAYQRLLLDCMVGDQTLFTRYDAVEVSWQLLMPVLQAWQNDAVPLYEYPAGSQSFPQADELIERDGRAWRKLGTQ